MYLIRDLKVRLNFCSDDEFLFVLIRSTKPLQIPFAVHIEASSPNGCKSRPEGRGIFWSGIRIA